VTTKADEIPRIEITIDDAVSLLDRVKTSVAPEDYQLLEKLVGSFVFMTQLLEKRDITLAEFRKLLFGMKSEKRTKILGDKDKDKEEEKSAPPEGKPGEPAVAGAENLTPPPDEKETLADGAPEKKRKGHGRKPADAYVGAEQVDIPHQTLKPGVPCPVTGCKGTLYALLHPQVLVRVIGRAPLGATVYRLGQLRCNLCLTVFTAEPPEGIGTEKFDETAASMIALLRYGTGLPFNRLEGLQEGLGIPLPDATQWDVVHEAYHKVAPALEQLITEGAQGDVFYNDDTTMKVLALLKENKERKERKEKGGDG
jgi:transposase